MNAIRLKWDGKPGLSGFGQKIADALKPGFNAALCKRCQDTLFTFQNQEDHLIMMCRCTSLDLGDISS